MTISVKNLNFFYGANQALFDINLTADDGDVVVLLGPSGAGKSTLIRTLNLLEVPQSGELSIANNQFDLSANNDPKQIRQLRRDVGMVFQQFNLLSNRTVAENVAFPLEIAKWPSKKIQARVEECLEIVDLQDRANHYPSQLSGGQKQRVGIARALAPQPQVILADEPTSALDPATTRSVLKCLEDINRRFNVTIVIVTHEMSVIRRLCDRAALLDKGRLLEIVEVHGNQIHAQSEIGQELIRED